MNRRTFLSLPLAAALLPRVAIAGAAGSVRFTIALARPDGRLVPLAAYADGRWQRAWPQADELPRDRPRIDTIPTIWRKRGERMPDTWHVWRSPDGPPLVTHVSGLDYADSHCSSQLALTTDLPPQMTPAHTFPLEAQIAADRDLPAEVLHLVQLVPKRDPRMPQAMHVVNARLGRSGPGRIIALYAEAGSGPSPMYVVAEHVAEHNYVEPAKQADATRPGSIVLTGWLMPDDFGRLSLRAATIVHAESDGKSVRTAHPLAGLHLGNRRFWVLRDFGYEDERSIIVELRARTIDEVLVINGGGC